MRAVSSNICTNCHVSRQLTFQLFGVDIAVSRSLEPQLMEINKGPDLGGKDTRDRELKQTMMNDIFKIIGLIQSLDHQFVKIWEKD